MNIEDFQHNHVRGQATSRAMWEALRQIQGAQGQEYLNLLKRKFFNYKTGTAGTIDEISSKISRLQPIIREIKETEVPTDLDVALTLINSVDNEAYTIANYNQEDLRDLTLANTNKRLKLVEQILKDEIPNKTSGKAKGRDIVFLLR